MNDDQQNDPFLSLSNAGLYRGNRWLVRGVDLEVRRGEIVTLVGPNGSGKTTTARLALGIVKPDEGTVTRAENCQIAYVPQRFEIDWSLPLKVERLMRLTASPTNKAMYDALEATGVAHLANSEVGHLSGGEFQRVLLARALARNPDLLVLDEPVQGVDFAGEVALYQLISKLRDQLNCGILLISHDLHVVMAATDRVVCLNGHICCQGTPQSVSENPEYLSLFGKKAAQTMAVYEHSHDHTHLPDGTVQHADGSISENCHPDDGHHDHSHGSTKPKKPENRDAG